MRGELPVRDTRRVPGVGSVSGSPSWGSPAGTWPTGFAGHPRVFHGGTARWSEPGRRDRSLPFPEPRQGPGRADNPWGTEPGSHRDLALPLACPTCPLPPGNPQHPVPVPQQVWAETLSFGRPTQRHVPFRDPPWRAAGRVGEGRTPHSGGFLLPGHVFPGSEASEQAGEASASRVSWTRGRARSCPAPGAVTQPRSSRGPAQRTPG